MSDFKRVFDPVIVHYDEHDFKHHFQYFNIDAINDSDRVTATRFDWELIDDDVEPNFDIIKSGILNSIVLDRMIEDHVKDYANLYYLINPDDDEIQVKIGSVSLHYSEHPKKNAVEYSMHVLWAIQYV